jgi:DNA-binding HxlR family transcriptional regulator
MAPVPVITTLFNSFILQPLVKNKQCKVRKTTLYLQVVLKFLIMRSDCPLNYGLEIFGDKWSLLIIRDLMFFKKRYYSQFLNSMEKISTNILAERLTLLETEGIISKERDANHKQKLVYSLTQKGIDLLPIIMEIGIWSDKYAKDLNPNRDIIIGEAKKDRKKAMEETLKKLQFMHLEKNTNENH